ncbi:MAG TPA: TPM domain-containing protein [Candidatus Sulfopaludibacter sp.]|jgi:uncharacterized protein|nr:TPM domain-containing protein [Candidatus Sulfopaludibacter sp.]
MISRAVLLTLTFALTAAAADYPASAGYFNDIPGMLPEAVQQALELRLRAYERATSNEVAVAIVPSLDGQTVDDYAKGLFHAWGIGKAEKSNGVLFLWAPTERKVRIQVGYGLEHALTDQDCTAILARVTPLLREERYAEGVQMAVDSILRQLGSAADAPPAEIPVDRSAREGNFGPLLVGGLILLAVLVVLMMHHHTTSAHRLQAELPAALAGARESLAKATIERARVAADLEKLRTEAPFEVWQPFTDLPDVEQLRVDLSSIEAMRREEYRELRTAGRALRHWMKRLEKTIAVFSSFRTTELNFYESRDYALEQIPRVSETLAALAEAGGPERNEALLAAARETLTRVHTLRAQPPVNWLLVRDLLQDAQACCLAETPTAPARTARYWPASGTFSPAFDLLSSQPYAPPADSGASFGGGDTGSGGASAGY